MTPLDDALAAMAAAPDDAAARLRLWDRFASSELFLLLEAPATADRLAPRLFTLADGPTAVAFCTEERLAEFGAGSDYAALSGRALARMMSEQAVALGLDLGSPHATVLPPQALEWLAGVLSGRPSQIAGLPDAVAPPRELGETFLGVLDARLPAMAGLASGAWLASATWSDGDRPLLVFVDPLPGAEAALAAAVGEALILSGQETGALDVGFASADSALAARLGRVALRLDLGQPEARPGAAPPGLDPDRPPRLR